MSRYATCVDDALPSEVINVDGHIVVEIFASFFTGESVTADDGGWVDLLFHQLLGIFQKFRGNDDN